MLHPDVAVDRFLERLDLDSGPTPALIYRGLVAWPGMSYHEPPVVPLGNMAELDWWHLPITQDSATHLEESFVFLRAEELAAPHNHELDLLARRYVEQYCGLIKSRARAGVLEQHPADLPEMTPPDWGKGLPKVGYTVGGWSMNATIDPSDWQTLGELHREIQSIREERTTLLKVELQAL